MKRNGASILLQGLKELGVSTIFGYPGGAVLPIYDELYHDTEIKHILTAHEQGASHAAHGYARVTGKVGVCITTSGPGATNAVTGIATAFHDSIPMVVLTGQVPSTLIGKMAFQEVDIISITKAITKKNYRVDATENIPNILANAFFVANSGRPGPVVIDLPKDIQINEIDYIEEKTREEFEKLCKEKESLDNIHNIEEAIEVINKAERPMIYAGGGVVISEGAELLKEFAEKIKSPVSCSLMGQGGFPGEHEYFTGLPGMHGTRTSNYAISHCDVLIAIGARFSDRVTGKASTFAKDAKIIHIDIDEKEFGKNIRADIPLKGEVKGVLEKLLPNIKDKTENGWNDKVKEWKNKHPLKYKDNGKLSGQYVVERLYEITQGEAIITTEVGQNQIWAAQYYKFNEPRTLVSSGGMGTMGFGLGAAIGACCAGMNKRVVNIAGDGSFKMNSVELATINRYRLPIVQLVLNNSVLGMVYQWQELFYGGRFSHTIFNNDVDFVKLGLAYDIKGFRITRKEEVDEVLKAALSLNEPVIIDCMIEMDEKVYPIVPPGADITEIID
ncbi:biosynthetic-type acetolactate synthase large subunit [Clostridium sp. DL1XJH146]